MALIPSRPATITRSTSSCQRQASARPMPEPPPKMRTQTLRQMERDGLIVRTVHPVEPPRVE